MAASHDEIERREKLARAAMKRALGTDEDEFGATLFVSHHLEEVEEAYWQEYLDAAHPEPSRVLDILELRSHWGDDEEDGIEVFEFTLPGDVTDYVISVSFDEDGQVEDISMES